MTYGEIEKIITSGTLGLAVGDAVGAPAEFGERWMRDEDPVKTMRSGGVFELPAGGWTDDTAMTLASMDSLRGGFDPRDMLDKFLLWLRQGEYSMLAYPIGMGKQILRALEQYEGEGNPALCGGRGERDNGNGSLMRILPVCLYGYVKQKQGSMTLPQVLAMVHEAGALTHGHDRSKLACGIFYFAAERILEETGPLNTRLQRGLDRAFDWYRGEPELAHYARVENVESLRQIPREEIRSSGYVVDTLEAALWSLAGTDSYRDCILRAVNLGLDTDTIAAVAGALAGLYYSVDGIERLWLDTLQQRERIVGFCRSLAEALS